MYEFEMILQPQKGLTEAGLQDLVGYQGTQSSTTAGAHCTSAAAPVLPLVALPLRLGNGKPTQDGRRLPVDDNLLSPTTGKQYLLC